MINKALYSSAKDDWETPQWLFDEYSDRFDFTVDVCASKKNAKVSHFFNKKQNGLKQPWDGHRVWCNPPYGRNSTGLWVKKAHLEVQAGECQLVAMLLPARTDTKWFHDYIYRQHNIEFLRGRLRFVGAPHSAPFPSMVVIFR